MMRRAFLRVSAAGLLLAVVLIAACGGNESPVVRPAPPPPDSGQSSAASNLPAPPEPVEEPIVVPAEPVPDDAISSASLDDLNRNSPLSPVFFAYDSSDLDAVSQEMLTQNSEVLKTYSTWSITIEGHADERGSAEYNLALGERRAVAAQAYLVSLGISADRVRTVSYGKEFPFDPGHSEEAWASNRRAHFVITGR
jgi:peptidoglycan-associated lipoprotein